MLDNSIDESRLERWFVPAILFLVAFLIVGLTLKDYGVAWDEPSYFYASDLHTNWILELSRNITTGDIHRSLSDEAIRSAWHWNPYNVPHPPFSRIISGLTKSALYPALDKFSAYRVGPALFFALLVVVMYVWIRELFGRAAGLSSALALTLTPNLFGYAHIAVTDLPLASLWFLAAYCFWKGLFRWQWSIALGVVWGLALSTKFPAVLIPLPLILWAHIFHRQKYTNNVFALLFLAPVFMIASQPYLWHQTGLRILEFLYEGISRAYRPDANFMIYFYHQLLFTQQLPWYYPFFIVGITTPEPMIVLAVLGGIASLWMAKQRTAILLFVANAIFVLMLGLVPGAVLHDGVRQMLSALPFLAALAGAGFCALASGVFKLGERWSIFKFTQQETILRAILILLIFALPAFDQISSHPFQLSYYNRLVGGIRGAYTRGLETTYFLEALNPELLDTLNKTLPENATITASFANFMLRFYQQEGRLRKDIKITATRPFDFYLLVNRRSVLGPRERNLMNAGVKAFASVGVADTPLVAVYDFREAR
jgi:4-amino-4-deoxy-L-arabinose transferase-like glycosyltransferase